MKSLLLTVLTTACAVALAGADRPVRNPFWPIGYEGRREVITSEVRHVPKKEAPEQPKAKKPEQDPAAAAAAAAAAEAARRAAEARARIITETHWTEARGSLRIGGRVVAKAPDGTRTSCAMINGNAYADGDLVSCNRGPNRFTWRVTGLSETNTLTLTRVRARRLDEIDKTQGGKGTGSSAKGERE